MQLDEGAKFLLEKVVVPIALAFFAAWGGGKVLGRNQAVKADANPPQPIDWGKARAAEKGLDWNTFIDQLQRTIEFQQDEISSNKAEIKSLCAEVEELKEQVTLAHEARIEMRGQRDEARAYAGHLETLYNHTPRREWPADPPLRGRK